MTCDERQDLWLLYASGGLEAEECLELERHLAGGCPRCAGARSEAEAVVAHLPLSLDAGAAPADLRERVLERAFATPRERTTPVKARPGWLPLAAGLALLLVGAAVVVLQSRRYEEKIATLESRTAETEARVQALSGTVDEQAAEIRRLEAVTGPAADVLVVAEEQRLEIEQLRMTLERLHETIAARDDEVRRLRRGLDQSELRLAAYRSPDVRIFSLDGTSTASGATAKVFWDTERRRWDFYTDGLEATGVARTYQLWFLTGDERKVSAGTFEVDPEGQGRLLDIQVPLDIGLITAAAVSLEPLGGSRQPTGAIHLYGAAGRS